MRPIQPDGGMGFGGQTWRSDITLLGYQNEAQAQNDFRQGKRDGVYMTSMRPRNKQICRFCRCDWCSTELCNCTKSH